MINERRISYNVDWEIPLKTVNIGCIRAPIRTWVLSNKKTEVLHTRETHLTYTPTCIFVR